MVQKPFDQKPSTADVVDLVRSPKLGREFHRAGPQPHLLVARSGRRPLRQGEGDDGRLVGKGRIDVWCDVASTAGPGLLVLSGVGEAADQLVVGDPPVLLAVTFYSGALTR